MDSEIVAKPSEVNKASSLFMVIANFLYLELDSSVLKKIQAYIANKEGSGLNPSTGVEVSRTPTKAYSGYVHAASP